MKLSRFFLAIAATGLLIAGADAYSFNAVYHVSQPYVQTPPLYIAKFGCDKGTCRYKVKGTIIDGPKPPPIFGSPYIQFRVLSDDDWNRFVSSDGGLLNCTNVHRAQRSHLKISLPRNAVGSGWISGSVDQKGSAHMWHFFVDDCEKSVGNAIGRTLKTAAAAKQTHTGFAQPIKIRIEMEIFQINESHLSYEDLNIEIWQVIQLLLTVFAFIYCVRRQTGVIKGEDSKLHIIPHIINVVLVFMIWCSILKIISLGKLMNSGQRYSLLETLADGISLACNATLSFALIMVAAGVTLKAKQTMTKSLAFLCLALLAASHICLVFFTTREQDRLFKHYLLEEWLGKFVFLNRIGLWVLFVCIWYRTVNANTTPVATARFLRKWFFPATLHFLTLPAMQVATAIWIPPTHRASFYFHFSFGAQLGAILALSKVFVTKGEYFEVSQMSQSILPVAILAMTSPKYNLHND